MAKCTSCGSEVGGGNSEKCSVTGSNHRFDRASDERERAERAGSPIEHPSVNWKRGPSDETKGAAK
jgi:hypothetical protein